MWLSVKTACLHSLTIAWGYTLALIGGFLSLIDSIGDALGSPDIKEQISSAVGDPRTVGRILLIISILTILARARSLRRSG